jgi:hypothetical protein
MEFHLPLTRSIEDLSAVRESVLALDPSAVVDTAADGRTLRIASVLGPLDLAWSLRRGGLPANADQLVTIPSVCCGGCSG